MVGGGDERQAQHGRAGEGAQDVGCVVFAVIDLETKRKQKNLVSVGDPDLRRAQKPPPSPPPSGHAANLQDVTLGEMKGPGGNVNALSSLHL